MGWLLSAVFQDANNQFYVVAYGVVRVETNDACKWFLTNLQADIGDETNHAWNFISDQQKGAWEYLSKFEPETWVKVYFSHGPKVDNLTNMCEVFNAKIVNYRCKPILTMCEEIRCYLVRRMVNHKRVLENHPGKLAPVQQKRMEKLVTLSTKWTAEWVGDNERKRFEVSRKGSKVDVNLIKYTCSCNRWQLTGMPCTHALAAIMKRRDRAEDYVHPWLCMESIKKTYSHCIKLVPSAEFWPQTNYSQLEPPSSRDLLAGQKFTTDRNILLSH
ncbi:uncharacterized protein [Arachis hypogaea]|uniref:uncharacterized protein n=1 Tax=Arachis hypogaea TaxID=3818 RepID=UPI003B20E8CD